MAHRGCGRGSRACQYVDSLNNRREHLLFYCRYPVGRLRRHWVFRSSTRPQDMARDLGSVSVHRRRTNTCRQFTPRRDIAHCVGIIFPCSADTPCKRAAPRHTQA